MQLADRVAIVTGSARGIGQAIALRLAGAGAAVVINDIGEPGKLEETASLVRSAGGQCLEVMADVTSAEDVAGLVEKTVAAFGKVDILVNNAGVTRDQLLIRMSEADWDTVLNVDLKSAFLCTRAVLRPMIKQRWGRIISIASIIGLVGNPGQTNYGAAKAGIIGFTRSIAREVASRGITANAVAPGFVDTDMTRQIEETQRQELLKRIPVGYFASPRDVAEAVAFFASEEARYITGQVLSVDGGMGGI